MRSTFRPAKSLKGERSRRSSDVLRSPSVLLGSLSKGRPALFRPHREVPAGGDPAESKGNLSRALKVRISLFVSIVLAITACTSSPPAEATFAVTSIPATASETETPGPTFTPTLTLTPTITRTPTISPTETITPTPTFAFPTATVNKQAHCRYGPSVAYLHAADLYPGDTGAVRGRHPYSTWHYVKFDKLKYFCWVAPSVVDVVGDVSSLLTTEPNLVTIGSNRYGPPKNVTAVRDGDEVTISWDQVNMTQDDDRGYFIEAFVCQGGFLLWWTFSYPDQFSTSYTVKDEAGCPEPSRGQLYTVEKHGYSPPEDIPWPAP